MNENYTEIHIKRSSISSEQVDLLRKVKAGTKKLTEKRQFSVRTLSRTVTLCESNTQHAQSCVFIFHPEFNSHH